MRHTKRSMITALTIAALGLLVTGCSGDKDDSGDIESVTHTQYQALPNFDASEQVMTDEAELDKLEEIFDRFDESDSDWIGTDPSCDGGLQTTLHVDFDNGSTRDIQIYRCGPDSSELVAQITDLVKSWRD